MKTAPGKIFYGWKIVAACFFIMCFSMGIVFNCNGMFIKPICEDLGVTRPQIALNVTLFFAGQIVVSLFSGKIFSRFQVRHVMQLSAVVISAATLGMGFARNLPMFYIFSALVGLSMGGICIVPISLLVSKWFRAKRGLAIGISVTGSGIGGMVFSPILGITIPMFGWRMNYIGAGILMAVVLLPLVFLVIRETPESVGLTPLGEISAPEKQTAEPEGMTLREAMRKPCFWILLVCVMFETGGSVAMNQHTSPYLTDIGYSYSFAAVITSLTMASLAAGKTLLGFIYDKTTPRFGAMFSTLCGILALAAVIFARFRPMLAVYTCCTGIFCAFGSVSFPILAESVFGAKDQITIHGIISVAGNLSVAVSPIITSSFYDITGTYRNAFLMFLILNIISFFCFFFILPGKKKKAA